MELLTYYDFSNNRYRVTKEKIHYLPMTPEQSSSGTYSGGEEKECGISMEIFAEIVEQVKAITENTSLHQEKRRMLTAMMVVDWGEESGRYIIRRSAEQKSLVALFKKGLGE